MSIGIVLGLGAVGTMAAWNDSSTATSGEFTTGRIDIRVGDPPVEVSPPAFATALRNSSLTPGAVVTAPLLVSNTGTVGFEYTMKVSATDQTLGALLSSSIFPNASCTGTAIGTVDGISGSKPFANAPRSVVARGSEQLCVSVSMMPGATLPATPVTGEVVYTFDAVSVST